MKTVRRKHSAEFKREAVALVTEQGYSCGAAGRSLSVSSNMVNRWKNQLEKHAGDAFTGGGQRTSEQQRIHELEAENRHLCMEKDILKKAIAFITKESSRGIDLSMSIKKPSR